MNYYTAESIIRQLLFLEVTQFFRIIKQLFVLDGKFVWNVISSFAPSSSPSQNVENTDTLPQGRHLVVFSVLWYNDLSNKQDRYTEVSRHGFSAGI